MPRVARLMILLVALPVPATAARDGPPEPARTLVLRSVRPETRDGEEAPRVDKYGLKYEDFDRIIEAAAELETALPIREFPKELRRRNRSVDGVVVGTTADYLRLGIAEVDRGRFLTEDDVKRYENVAVLGPAAVEDLFPAGDPIGESVKVGSDYYTVVNTIMRTKDSPSAEAGPLRRDVARDVIIPLTTVRLRFGERIIDNREGRMRAEETQLARIVLIFPTAEARDHARDEVGDAVFPYHPEGDVSWADRAEAAPAGK